MAVREYKAQATIFSVLRGRSIKSQVKVEMKKLSFAFENSFHLVDKPYVSCASRIENTNFSKLPFNVVVCGMLQFLKTPHLQQK
jgi:hypothetical protein